MFKNIFNFDLYLADIGSVRLSVRSLLLNGHVLFRNFLQELLEFGERYERILQGKTGPGIVLHDEKSEMVYGETSDNVHVHSNSMSMENLRATQVCLQNGNIEPLSKEYSAVSIDEEVTDVLVDLPEMPGMFSRISCLE